jgi:phage/plasmid-like protein (TIGR03299 family)
MARRTQFTQTDDRDQMERLFGFTIEARPLFTEHEGERRAVTGKTALVRTDTGDALGVASPRYGIVQPRTGLDIMQACGDLEVLKAGMIGQGQRMYVQARLRGAGFDIAGQEHEAFLFLGMHNDASGCYFIGLTPTRIICWNQLRVAIDRMSARFAIRHTGNAQARAEMATEVIGRARAYFGTYSVQAAALVNQRFSVQSMGELAEELWPTPKADNLVAGVLQKRAQVVRLFAEGRLNTGIHGTKYGALNAVAEYLDHGQERQGGDAGKVNALLFNLDADRQKQIAWDRLAA